MYFLTVFFLTFTVAITSGEEDLSQKNYQLYQASLSNSAGNPSNLEELKLSLQDFKFYGPNYQQEDSNLKGFQLYQASLNDRTPGKFYTYEEAELFIENTSLSFNTVGDEMPYQFAGLKKRLKVIHSVGVVGRGSWVANPDSPFTGVLGSGCKNVILRLSVAQRPLVILGKTLVPFVPGVALKCLRDGVPSGNMVFMYSLGGQTSYNFFKHDLSNHVPYPGENAPLGTKLVLKIFSEVSDYPTTIGLSDLAKFSEDGTKHEPPVFPFRLILHPVSNWHSFYPDEKPSITFEEQMQSTLVPGPLYDIYAQVEPTDDNTKVIHIGRIDLTTSTSTSIFGDTKLFFQHTRMEDDLHYRPEWVDPAKEIIAQQSLQEYVFPDLPW